MTDGTFPATRQTRQKILICRNFITPEVADSSPVAPASVRAAFWCGLRAEGSPFSSPQKVRGYQSWVPKAFRTVPPGPPDGTR
jgi:hypothetical protein